MLKDWAHYNFMKCLSVLSAYPTEMQYLGVKQLFAMYEKKVKDNVIAEYRKRLKYGNLN